VDLVECRDDGEHLIHGTTKAKGVSLKEYYTETPLTRMLLDVHESGQDAPKITTRQIYTEDLRLKLREVTKKTFSPNDTKWFEPARGEREPFGWAALRCAA
jgi:hypothetical protein